MEKWTDKMIDALLKCAKDRFETDIPKAVEIRKLRSFLFDLTVSYWKADKACIEAKFVFKWWHIPYSNTRTIELPEAAVWALKHQMSHELEFMCDNLAKICCFKEKGEIER